VQSYFFLIVMEHLVRIALILAIVWCITLHAANAYAVDIACKPLVGIEATDKAQVLIFGDLHGTVEPPAIFGQAACRFAAQLGSRRGVIGLELPENFNDYFTNVDTATLRQTWKRVRADTFWNELKDGRHSAAMLALVRRLLGLSTQSGGKLRLVAVERQPIDRDGAAIFVASMKSFSAERGLVFIGNAHARLRPMPGQAAIPFAKNVEDAGFDVLSLNIKAGGGMGRVCAPACEAKPVFPMPEAGGVKIVMEQATDEQPWSGYYYIPKLSLAQAVHVAAKSP
jgi:hypothetical protein